MVVYDLQTSMAAVMLLLYIYVSRAGSKHFLYAESGIAVGGMLLSSNQSLRATVAQPESDRPGHIDKLAGNYHVEISRRQQVGVSNTKTGSSLVECRFGVCVHEKTPENKHFLMGS